MQINGPWSREEVATYLDETVIPMRLACNREDGFPLVASHWFVRKGDVLWCAVHGGSVMARRLASDPSCGFEVSGDLPPYYGVRGRAQAQLIGSSGSTILGELIDRYLGRRDSTLAQWLLGRAEGELAVRLEPLKLFTWDYRERMR